MKRYPADILWVVRRKDIFVLNSNSMEVFQMILTDEICDKLCAATSKKAGKSALISALR